MKKEWYCFFLKGMNKEINLKLNKYIFYFCAIFPKWIPWIKSLNFSNVLWLLLTYTTQGDSYYYMIPRCKHLFVKSFLVTLNVRYYCCNFRIWYALPYLIGFLFSLVYIWEISLMHCASLTFYALNIVWEEHHTNDVRI